jgi:hypothetical protein
MHLPRKRNLEVHTGVGIHVIALEIPGARSRTVRLRRYERLNFRCDAALDSRDSRERARLTQEARRRVLTENLLARLCRFGGG